MTEDEIPSYLFDFYENLDRKAPGDETVTRGLFSLLPGLPTSPRVIDMGCGTGASALVLAQAGARVTGVDIRPSYLGIMREKAAKAGVSDRIDTWCGPMDAVPAALGPFDVVWSEGSVFVVGFEAGLSAWRDLVRPGGYVVVSELCWLRESPPKEIAAYFEANYPGIGTMAGCLETAERCGYTVIGTYVLSETAWDEYLAPQPAQVARFRKGAKTPDEQAFLDGVLEEVGMWETFRGWYGYIFTLMKKTGEGV